MAKDSHGRTIDYLRISVTDRCNLRCLYCMPAEGVVLKSHEDMLSLEEIARLVRVAASCGITRIRLTGGEPLVRKGICDLVSEISHIDGIQAIAMTTNGILLPEMAQDLKDAGLERVNISLDTLDPEMFKHITRCGDLQKVLDGIDAALDAGLAPVKINTVVVRSLQQDLLGFARMSYEHPLHIRFIEYMPVGDSAGALGHGWTKEDSVPSAELVERISQQAREAGLGELQAIGDDKAPENWGPARYYQLPGAKGTLGFISPLSRHFCKYCNRLRLTSDGKIRPCLFSDNEFDVRTALREGTEDDVRAAIQTALANKPDEHHYRVGTDRQMSQIGG